MKGGDECEMGFADMGGWHVVESGSGRWAICALVGH